MACIYCAELLAVIDMGAGIYIRTMHDQPVQVLVVSDNSYYNIHHSNVT